MHGILNRVDFAAKACKDYVGLASTVAYGRHPWTSVPKTTTVEQAQKSGRSMDFPQQT